MQSLVEYSDEVASRKHRPLQEMPVVQVHADCGKARSSTRWTAVRGARHCDMDRGGLVRVSKRGFGTMSTTTSFDHEDTVNARVLGIMRSLCAPCARNTTIGGIEHGA